MNQKLEIQYLAIQELLPYARNARTHSPAQIRQLANPDNRPA